MTLVDEDIVQKLMRAHLQTVVNEAVVPVHWENQRFTPPGASPPPIWMRETIAIANELEVAWGTNETLGQWRVDVFGLSGEGTETPKHWARVVANAFDAVNSLSGSGVAVTIDGANREPGRIDDSEDSLGGQVWYMVPVVVEWRTYTTKG